MLKNFGYDMSNFHFFCFGVVLIIVQKKMSDCLNISDSAFDTEH